MRPALPIGPRVLGIQPALASNVVTEILVTFSQGLDLSTFTGADVQITGPQATSVSVITLVNGATYRVTLATALSTAGTYSIAVGPDITAAASGYKLDQDRDGIGAEAGQDVFTQALVLDRSTPVVTAQTPTGTQTAAVGQVVLTFNEAIQSSTFTPADVTLTGPGGAGVQVLAVDRISDTQFRIRFPVQFVNGTYTLNVGPDIADLAGNVLTAAYVGSFVIDRSPLRVVSQTPSGIVHSTTSSITVGFSVPVNPASFTAADVSLAGPRGPVAITGIATSDNITFILSFAPVSIDGTYQLIIGPDIADAAGILMDQDGDGIPGQVADRYTGGFQIDGAGPYVLSQSAAGSLAGGLDHIDIRFSEPVLLGSVQLGDFALAGPNGGVTLTGFTALADDTYRVTFAALSLGGAYTLTVGPAIADPGGTHMDQDRNGVPGETPGDQWTGSFTLDVTRPTVTVLAPTATVNAPLNRFDVTFSETVSAASVSLADFSLAGPSGAIAIDSVTQNSGASFSVFFASQRANGLYTLSVGPEITDTAGNTMAAAEGGTVTIALPDLAFANPSAPGAIGSGQTLTVNYSLENHGTLGAAAPWVDRLVLSTDSIYGNGDDVVLASRVQNDPIAAGGSDPASLSAQIPLSQATGSFTVFVVTDAAGAVEESDEANNLAALVLLITNSGLPDLVVAAVSGPTGGSAGSTASVDFTVENIGNGPTSTGSWKDRIYLSTDAAFSAGDVLLAERTHAGVLSPMSTYSDSATVTLPSGISGSFYFIVVTDAANDVQEPGSGAEGNNAGASAAIAITLPPSADLRVDSASSAQTILIGDPADFTVTWTVSNQGSAATNADTWKDRVIFSPDNILGNGGDFVVGEFTHTGALPVGASYTDTEVALLPASLTGRFYVFVVTDALDTVLEAPDNASNSLLLAQPVDVMTRPYSDLIVASVGAATSATAGGNLSVTWTVQNQGIGTTSSPQWVDRIFISTDSSGSNAILLSDEQHIGNLDINGTYTRSADLPLPLGIGGATSSLSPRTRTTASSSISTTTTTRRAPPAPPAFRSCRCPPRICP